MILGIGAFEYINDITLKNFLNFGQYKKSSKYFIPILIFSLIFLITSTHDVEAALFEVDLNDSLESKTDIVQNKIIQVKLNDQLQVTTKNSNQIRILNTDQLTSEDELTSEIIPGAAGAAGGGGRATGGGSVAISGLLLLGDLTKGIGGKILDSNLGDPETAQIFQVGEEVVLKFGMIASRGIFGLEHATLYMNIRDDKNSIDDSDSYIRFIAFEDLIVKNDSGLFSSVDFNKTKTDAASFILEYYIIFAKPMEVSDIYLSTWNFDKRPTDQRFKNAIKIIPERIDKDFTLSPPDVVVDTPSVTLDTDLLMGWAGLSKESVTDDELLEHLNIEGQEIPSWVKKSGIGKWISQGIINEEDFLKIIQYLYSEGIIV